MSETAVSATVLQAERDQHEAGESELGISRSGCVGCSRRREIAVAQPSLMSLLLGLVRPIDERRNYLDEEMVAVR